MKSLSISDEVPYIKLFKLLSIFFLFLPNLLRFGVIYFKDISVLNQNMFALSSIDYLIINNITPPTINADAFTASALTVEKPVRCGKDMHGENAKRGRESPLCVQES